MRDEHKGAISIATASLHTDWLTYAIDFYIIKGISEGYKYLVNNENIIAISILTY